MGRLNMSKKSSKQDQLRSSIFPRLVFKPDDVTLGNSARIDPMLKGVDLDALKPVTQKIELMQERLLLPAEYSIHNEFQLLPERFVIAIFYAQPDLT